MLMFHSLLKYPKGIRKLFLINMPTKLFISACLFLLLGIATSFAQTKQEELEQKRAQLMREIKQLQEMVAVTKNKERSVLTEVEDLNTRITARENLIKVTNQQ